MRTIWILFFAFLLSACSAAPQPKTDSAHEIEEKDVAYADSYYANQEVQQFVEYMVTTHKYDRDILVKAFSSIEKREQVITKSDNQPEVITPYYQYATRFLEPYRIQKGIEFAQRNRPWLLRAEEEYGVDWHVIVALLGVETAYGRVTGNRDVFTSLTTLSFDYPRRADYFRSELEAYLLLARREGWGLGTTNGSYSGALGMVQFMPSNYLKLALDYDGNGVIELWDSEIDAIGSVANYLRRHGWQRGKLPFVSASVANIEPIADWVNKGRKPEKSVAQWQQLGVTPSSLVNGQAGLIGLRTAEEEVSYWLAFENFFTVMDYNPSRRYAMSVLELAHRIKAGAED
ncbi:lytic murein transglycosylase B [Maribrevibacterium harenarium]|uniref:Lytic murein transglycosylase B n=1 Tax=Maribrevibacterium harenarium TaxID=2589817 RepID=A0A501WN51_9GAMM|nr:lytic murein transglycosylase B [Maribrevibacterium harenarium]TPE48727.1 lytic murein transglycosylase B [Maribrevibacterium harenarium]